MSASRRFFAVPCQVSRSLALEASFLLDFVRFDAADVSVAEKHALSQDPFRCFYAVKPDTEGCMRSKRCVFLFEPCNILDFDSFICQIVLLRDFGDVSWFTV